MVKCVVLDTNVFIENPECIYDFNDCHIVIPIAVIEELDNLKNNNSFEKRHNARKSSNMLDELTDNINYIENGFIKLKNGSTLSIEPNHRGNIEIEPEKPDNRIISVAVGIKKEFYMKKYNEIVLVSRDMNVRIKARQYKIKAKNYDYYAEQLKSVDTGIIEILVSPEEISKTRILGFYEVKENLRFNQHAFLIDETNINNKILMTYDNISQLQSINDYTKKTIYKDVRAKNSGQNFAINDIMNIYKPVNIITSTKAGCGKNYIITACCLNLLEIGEYNKLIYIKPMVSVDGKDIGSLPGTKNEKISVWFQNEEDTMEILLGGKKEKYNEMIEEGMVELDIVSFARGRNIPNAIIWINEAQNFTAHQIWTIATRVAKSSKLIVSGDLSQIDNKHLDLKNCGLNVFSTVSRNNPDATYICLTNNKNLRGPVAEWYSENSYI